MEDLTVDPSVSKPLGPPTAVEIAGKQMATALRLSEDGFDWPFQTESPSSVSASLRPCPVPRAWKAFVTFYAGSIGSSVCRVISS